MNIIKKLRSNEFAVVVAILSVLVQSFHSYYAFYNVSTLKGTAWGVAQAVLFAIVFDLAILFYTVRNKRDVVLGAAFFLVMINVYYYYQHLGFTFEFIFGCFLSVIIPVTQYYYSEEIRDDLEEDPINPYHYAKIIEDKDEEIDKVEEIVRNKSKIINELDVHLGQRLDEIKTLEGERDHLKTFLTKAEAANKEYYTLVAQRDNVLNSNSVLSEALGRKEREIFELKKKAGEIPEDAILNPEKIVEDLDQSLLNISAEKIADKGYKPLASNAPYPQPETDR